MFMQIPGGDPGVRPAKDQVQEHCRKVFEHLLHMRENLEALNLGLLDSQERMRAEMMRDGISNLIDHIDGISSKGGVE